MKQTAHFIPVRILCAHYELEVSFFYNLGEVGLLEVETIASEPHIHEDSLRDLEKIIRMRRDLDLEPGSIAVVFHLLQKIDDLNEELEAVKSRLRLYE
jgi:hypothetical protein